MKERNRAEYELCKMVKRHGLPAVTAALGSVSEIYPLRSCNDVGSWLGVDEFTVRNSYRRGECEPPDIRISGNLYYSAHQAERVAAEHRRRPLRLHSEAYAKWYASA